MSLTLVHTAPDREAAGTLESFLTSRGLSVCATGAAPGATGPVSLFVPRAQAGRARELLRSGPEEPELAPEPEEARPPEDPDPRAEPASPEDAVWVPRPEVDPPEVDPPLSADRTGPEHPTPAAPDPADEPLVVHRAHGAEAALLLAAYLRHHGVPAWAPVEDDPARTPVVIGLEGDGAHARHLIQTLLDRLGATG